LSRYNKKRVRCILRVGLTRRREGLKESYGRGLWNEGGKISEEEEKTEGKKKRGSDKKNIGRNSTL